MEFLPFSAFCPNLEFAKISDKFSDNVRENYSELKRQNYFQVYDKESVFVYEISFASRNYTGVIGLAAYQDYLDGVIKRHELTIDNKEIEHLKLFNDRKAIVKPILLSYEVMPEISSRLESLKETSEILYSCKIGKEKHRIWAVQDAALLEAVRKIDSLYIADGHHRITVGTKLYLAHPDDAAYAYFPIALFDFSQLEIKGFHRLVKFEHFDGVIDQLSLSLNITSVEKYKRPTHKYELAVYYHNQWYFAKWKPEVLAKYADKTLLLDTELLNSELLGPVFGISDFKNDSRIQYVEGNTRVDKIEAIDHKDVIFFRLFPISFAEFKKVSDDDISLPPKSTWFFPRIRNGLIVHEY